MDPAKAVTHIGLCAGYGGIELGLKRAIPNLHSVALCEIEAFAIANLVAKMEAGLMDASPIWTDLKTFPWAAFRDRVDILTGGYPCQPFSSAGKRLGKEDPRHLWPYIADGIRILRPGLCFFENVEGHISLGLRDVIEELESIGYKASWGIFSAAEVGAPHQRKRVFILAYNQRQRIEEFSGRISVKSEQHPSGYNGRDVWPTRPESVGNSSGGNGGGHRFLLRPWEGEFGRASRSGSEWSIWPSRPGEPQHEWEPPRVVGNSEDFNGRAGVGGEKAGAGEDAIWWRGPGEPDQREAQSSMGGDAYGTPDRMDYAELFTTCDNRTDELRLLGNGVVPATAERAFRVLMEELLS